MCVEHNLPALVDEDFAVRFKIAANEDEIQMGGLTLQATQYDSTIVQTKGPDLSEISPTGVSEHLLQPFLSCAHYFILLGLARCRLRPSQHIVKPV